MTQYKNAKVILLPTQDNPTSISIGNNSKIVEYHEFLFWKKEGIYNNHTFQHLYIISDDQIKDFNEIEDGVCLYDNVEKIVFQKGNNGISNTYTYHLLENEYNLFKVVATTNTSLKEIIPRHNDFDSVYDLPQPSQEFIEYYISEYNQGRIITNVLVEYEKQYLVENFYNNETKYISNPNEFIENNKNWFIKQNKVKSILKINPNNAITIKEKKESWSREDVKNKLRELYHSIDRNEVDTIEEWLKENLL